MLCSARLPSGLDRHRGCRADDLGDVSTFVQAECERGGEDRIGQLPEPLVDGQDRGQSKHDERRVAPTMTHAHAYNPSTLIPLFLATGHRCRPKSSSSLQDFANELPMTRLDPTRRPDLSPIVRGANRGAFATRSFVRCCLVAALLIANVTARGPRAEAGGLPLPRFASLKKSPVDERVGPGVQYEIKWVYVRPKIPLEIYEEYGNWRRVRDWQGATGWILGTLLSGRRTAVVAPWSTNNIRLYQKPSSASTVAAWLEPNVIVRLVSCDGRWCRVAVTPMAGFVKQSRLWGIYPNEVF